MNLYKEKILSHSLKGQRRAHHKYLYIDENGRYVYPEDVKNKVTGAANTAGNVAKGAATATGIAVSNMKDKASKAIADQKQKFKDKKFVKESEKLKKKDVADEYGSYDKWLKEVNKHNAATDKGKLVNQINSAHARSTVGGGLHLLSYQKGEHGTTENLEKQKEKTKQRKQAARDVKSEAQRKSAHAGYEADRRKFPEGGSTEELEIQKEKTAARKRSQQMSNSQRKSAHAGYEADRKKFPEGGSTEELERQKRKTALRKWDKNKNYSKQKYSANQAESERHKAAPTLSKDYRDAMGYAPSLDKQIEKTRKRRKAKQVRALYK